MTEQEKRSYIEYRLSKADETLNAARVLAKEGIWTSVVNRLYYAAFYAVSALMVLDREATKTHKGLKTRFNDDFVRTQVVSKESGKVFNKLYTQRHRGDYDDFVEFPEEDVMPMIGLVGDLIEEVRATLL